MSSQIRRDILKGWTVLVVDDELDSQEVASRILRHYGAFIHTAFNGKFGLDLARSVHPRFIVSDLSMPVMDGWELLHQLKLDVSTVNIPVIALTAHAMVGDRERAIAAGFHNYLTKPLTPATFMRDLLGLLTDIPELAADLMELEGIKHE
nr:Response regulator receiver domain protein [uncultured bacterium]